MESTAVLVVGTVREALRQSMPYITSKPLRAQLRAYLEDGRIPYGQLARISRLMSRAKRTAHLPISRMEDLEKSAVFVFGPHGTGPRDARTIVEQREYNRMLGIRPDESGDSRLFAHSSSHLINLILTVVAASVATFLLLRYFAGISLEASIISSVILGMLFIVAELYFINRMETS